MHMYSCMILSPAVRLASESGSGAPRCFWLVEQREQIGLGLLHRLSCGQVGLGVGLGLHVVQRDTGLEADQPLRAELRQTRQWSLHVLVAIALDDLALGADDLGGEQARAVQIEPRIEGFFVERVDGLGVLLRDVAVAHVLPDHAGVLALGQGVVVAVARARFGLLDAQLLQHQGDLAVDVLRAVVGVKALDLKRKLFDHQGQYGQQECLADALHAGLHLPLAHRIHAGDVVDPLRPVGKIRYRDSSRCQALIGSIFFCG